MLKGQHSKNNGKGIKEKKDLDIQIIIDGFDIMRQLDCRNVHSLNMDK